MKFLRAFLIIILASFVVVSCSKGDANQTMDKAHVEQIVHDYLLAHPEILVQVSQKLQQQQAKQMQDTALAAINDHSNEIFKDAHSLVVGNPKGNVTLVEFFDYQCVHCAHMYPVVQSLIKSNKNLRVVLKEFPIFGAASQYAAMAVLAAAKQGKGAQMHDALFTSGLIEGKLTNAAVIKMAKKLGLNIAKLQKDMSDADVKNEINSTYQLARVLNLQGTPGFIIAATPGMGKGETAFIPGASSVEQLQAAINKA